ACGRLLERERGLIGAAGARERASAPERVGGRQLGRRGGGALPQRGRRFVCLFVLVELGQKSERARVLGPRERLLQARARPRRGAEGAPLEARLLGQRARSRRALAQLGLAGVGARRLVGAAAPLQQAAHLLVHGRIGGRDCERALEPQERVLVVACALPHG